jgi:hypothetical protein
MPAPRLRLASTERSDCRSAGDSVIIVAAPICASASNSCVASDAAAAISSPSACCFVIGPSITASNSASLSPSCA